MSRLVLFRFTTPTGSVDVQGDLEGNTFRQRLRLHRAVQSNTWVTSGDGRLDASALSLTLHFRGDLDAALAAYDAAYALLPTATRVELIDGETGDVYERNLTPGARESSNQRTVLGVVSVAEFMPIDFAWRFTGNLYVWGSAFWRYGVWGGTIKDVRLP